MAIHKHKSERKCFKDANIRRRRKIRKNQDKVEISTQTEDVELNENFQDEQITKGTQIEEYQNYCFCCNYSYCKCKAKNHIKYFCPKCKYYKCYKGKGGIYRSKNGMYWKKDNNGKDRLFDNRFHQIKLPWE